MIIISAKRSARLLTQQERNGRDFDDFTIFLQILIVLHTVKWKVTIASNQSENGYNSFRQKTTT